MAPSASLSPCAVSVMVSPFMSTRPSFIILTRLLMSASSATSSIPRSCWPAWPPSSLCDQMNSRTSSTALSFVINNPLSKRYPQKPDCEIHDSSYKYGKRKYEKRHPECGLEPPFLDYHEEVRDARHEKGHRDKGNDHLHRVEQAVFLERKQAGGAVIPAEESYYKGFRRLWREVGEAPPPRGYRALYLDK